MLPVPVALIVLLAVLVLGMVVMTPAPVPKMVVVAAISSRVCLVGGSNGGPVLLHRHCSTDSCELSIDKRG
ncbi:hypothetical protein F5Y16DRAFT_379192 [Xylariaceae sp. FL0255]|nr:hypothetical protein F5Y16DRAFT_379192 [Xylariaceae sp. FL0255]